jgi:hypothetical protein
VLKALRVPGFASAVGINVKTSKWENLKTTG